MAGYLRQLKTLPESTVAVFSRQIAKGLLVLDSYKIIHRDIKPENLLLLYRGSNPEPENIVVKIADFGLARFLPSDIQAKLTQQCGTIAYMAPESFSQSYDSKVDIWSFGLIIHQMFFGSLPFANSVIEISKNYVCPVGASTQLQDLLNSMLKHDSADRINIKAVAAHNFLKGETPRERLTEIKKRYLPDRMSRVEKRKLYGNAIGLSEIAAWLYATSPDSLEAPMCDVDHDLNKKVSIWTGDITKLEIDAIVNPSNPDLEKGTLTGANKVIHEAAGPQLEQETKGLIGGCDYGSAEVTAGYKLPAYYVIHTVGPQDKNDAVLTSCYESCLQKVLDYKIKTIAFSAIATGNFGFPIEDATKVALKTVREWMGTETNRSKVERVIFACFNKSAEDAYNKYMPIYFPKE